MAAALRVVSWNIRAAIGPGPFPDRWWSQIDADRLRAIGAFLVGLDADVIALQEVALLSRDGAIVDNAGDLARQLRMDVCYGAVRTFEVVDDGATSGAGLFGNAILSRRQLANAHVVALPAAPIDSFVEPAGSDDPAAGVRYADASPAIREPRCLVLATIDGFRLATTHFSHVGSGERRLQAEATARALDGATPALIVGDLNAPIEAEELAAFESWADAFVEPRGHAARVTTDDGWRIDHALARGASVSPARLLRAAGELSDHYPILVEVAAP